MPAEGCMGRNKQTEFARASARRTRSRPELITIFAGPVTERGNVQSTFPPHPLDVSSLTCRLGNEAAFPAQPISGTNGKKRKYKKH